MDGELICGKCSELLTSPVTLPCSHNICYGCSKECTFETTNNTHRKRSKQSKNDVSKHHKKTENFECRSDSSDYSSKSEFNASLHQQLQGPLMSIKCPKCNVSYVLDERGVNCLPRNLIAECIIEKQQINNTNADCQLCETTPPSKATVTCEQCCVSYCDECLAVCHPKRGPLALHSLIEPDAKRLEVKHKGVLKCPDHSDENISMYCTPCKTPVCYLCIEEGRHGGHESKALGVMCKEQKAEMRKSLSLLKEKNKELELFIEELQENIIKVQENNLDFEAHIVAKIDDVIQRLEKKKTELIDNITENVSSKIKKLSDQKEKCEFQMKATCGLIKYTDEAVNESDAAIYLLISNYLCGRLALTLETWIGKHGLDPVVSSDVDIHLPIEEVIKSIEACQFAKGVPFEEDIEPSAPSFDTDACLVDNNTLTLKWRMKKSKIRVDSFVVEIDDGMNGEFQSVHHTDKCQCVLGGLQFRSKYRTRVRALNKAGEGKPSDIIYMTTPLVAYFKLDVETSHPDIVFSNQYRTVTSSSFENRVTLGNVGFTRGVHYWEVSIDRYEGNPDPAIGVAQADCTKDAILGKDQKAWSVYVDSTRSWFQHNNAHNYRSEGGIQTGSVIGLLLDLDQCSLTFYRNEEKHGPIKFPSLQYVPVVYPAFSLNRNVNMTLYTGLPPPDY